MSFADVKIRQRDAYQRIIKSVENDRTSHAYLFSGNAGTGKMDLAYAFACYYYCISFEKPCGECANCKSILNNTFPNVYVIDKDSIKKEDIVTLQKVFSQSSLMSGKRFYIINNADTFNQFSSNSLLKFIEEPANDNVVGILITPQVDSVISTIRSRCQIVNFKPFSKVSLVNKLVEHGFDESYAKTLYCISNDLDELLEYNEEESLLKIYSLIKECGVKFTDSKYHMPIYIDKISKVVGKNKKYQDYFFTTMLTYFKDVLLVMLKIEDVVFTDDIDTLRVISSRYNKKSILSVVEAIKETKHRFYYNVNAELTYSNMSAMILKGV